MSEPKKTSGIINNVRPQKQISQPSPIVSDPPIDIDTLAKEKVDEIEQLLDSKTIHPTDDLNSWLTVLKKIITAADLHRTNDKNDNRDESKSKPDAEDSIYADFADDNEQFNAVDPIEQFESNSVKWTIRVRAFKTLHRIVSLFANPSTIRLLPDLIRLAFVAATSPYDDLKMQGFGMFKFLISKFSNTEERELPGHSILGQYRTQVLSALKPAFNLDAPPYITAVASQVCSLWICRGLETDSLGLKRAFQFMLQATEKLDRQSVNHHSKLYTESELEQERLGILDSWAQLYITSQDSEMIDQTASLGTCSRTVRSELAYLVEASVELLVDRWWEALKDFALLTMPAPKFIGVSHDNEDIYTREVALRLFEPVWSNLVLATTFWLCSCQESVLERESRKEKQICDNRDEKSLRSGKEKYYKFTSGLLMRELCRCQHDIQSEDNSLKLSTVNSIKSLSKLLSDKSIRTMMNLDSAEEFYSSILKLYFNRIKSKDPFHKNVKPILDSLFELLISGTTQDAAKSGEALEYLISSISSLLNSDDDSRDPIIYVTKAIMRTNNLIALIKFRPQLFKERKDLLDASVNLFKKMVEFKESSMAINLSNNLLRLNSVLPAEEALVILKNLFESEICVIQKLVNSIRDDKNNDKDVVARSIPQLDAHMRLARAMIGKSESEQKLDFTRIYLKFMVELVARSNKSNESARYGEVVKLLLRQIEEAKRAMPTEFEASMTGDMTEILESIQKPKDTKETSVETKRNPSPKKPVSCAPKAKITLKADFSNFYAKKA